MVILEWEWNGMTQYLQAGVPLKPKDWYLLTLGSIGIGTGKVQIQKMHNGPHAYTMDHRGWGCVGEMFDADEL